MANDITAIKQLLAAYCHRVDRGTPAEVATLFAADAVLRPFYDGRYEVRGRSGIEGWYAYYEKHFKSGVRHLKHMVMSPLIEVTGSRASGVTYLIASAVTIATGDGFFATGTYHDEFRQVDDRWLFAMRQIEVEYMTTPTKAIEKFPPLGFPNGTLV
ncbi:MAG: nuclear transport factor 2 family protein [Gammaproteobacteria bacterium]|nr:nuclear transport factor 2 family protein [Gammaproteobacteria bacterium]